MTFGIKLISGLERKAAPAAEAVGAKVEKALVGKSSIVSDVVDLNNKARECFKDIFGMYGRQIKKDANACFDTKVVLGGFEHFKLKPSYAGYPHGFEFFGTKQNLIKYLKKNNVPFTTEKVQHGNILISYDKPGNYCTLRHNVVYSHKNGKFMSGHAHVPEHKETAILSKSKDGYNFRFYDDTHGRNPDPWQHIENTTFTFDKNLKVTNSRTSIGYKEFELNYDKNGAPSLVSFENNYKPWMPNID